jgi:hypothetical protein
MTPFEPDNLPHVHRIGKYASGLMDLCDWASVHTKGSLAVEVGSYLGESAQIISRYYRTLWCVDPWGNNHQGTPAEDIFLKRFPGANTPQGCVTSWGSWVYMLKMESPRASFHFEDPLDFLYIDGNHDYAPCKADIEAWVPKVKQGVVAGHDYDPILQPGVVKAVDEVLGKPENVFIDTSWAFVVGEVSKYA